MVELKGLRTSDFGLLPVVIELKKPGVPARAALDRLNPALPSADWPSNHARPRSFRASAARRMGMPSNDPSASKSLSPVTIASASAATAQARTWTVSVNDQLHAPGAPCVRPSPQRRFPGSDIGSPGCARIPSSTLLRSAAALRRRNSTAINPPTDAESSRPLARASFSSASGKSNWMVMLKTRVLADFRRSDRKQHGTWPHTTSTGAVQMRGASGNSQKPSADRKFPVRLASNVIQPNQSVNCA